MIRRFIVFIALMSSACPEPIADRCGDGLPPCATGFMCVAGLCARLETDAGQTIDGGVRPDAGTSDAGATDAGSRDAGALFACDGGCAPWSVCVASNVSATCVNGRLEVSEPVDATTLRAGQSVSVAARFVLVDGGAWPNTLAIPVQASWGPQTMLLSGIAGSVAGLSDAGQGSVVFGWDGGPAEPRAVSFAACAAEVVSSCDVFMECAPSASGGACVSHGYVVEWVSPDAGSATNQSSVLAELRVSKPDAGVVTLTSIPVTGATAFAGASGRYTGTLPIAAPDGIKTFTAGWPSDGASSTLTIERDTIAPSVTVVVEPRNGPDPDLAAPTAWKKDEKALIKITVDGGRPAVAGDVRPPPNGVVTAEACGGCSGACRCFGIDVSSTPLNGLRGPMGVQVLPINDPAGNRTEQKDAGFDVTRLRWFRTMSIESGTTATLAPSLSVNGLVVFAVGNRTGLLPRLQVYNPSGALQLSAVTKRITGAAVVGAETLWVPTFDEANSTSAIQSVLLSDAGTGSVCELAAAPFSGVALGLFNAATEAPIAMRNGLHFGTPTCPSLSIAAPASEPTPVVVRQFDGGSDVFVGYGSSLTRASTNGLVWNDLGARSDPVVTFRSLFLDGYGRIGGGGGVVALPGPVRLVSASDHRDGGTLATSPQFASGLVVGADRVYGSPMFGRLAAIAYGPTGLPDSGFELDAGVQSSDRQFVLGAADRLLDVAILGGPRPLPVVVRVSQLQTSTFVEDWSGFPLSTIDADVRIASPALDVYRSASGVKDCSRPIGVLYVPVSVDSSTTLYSILVDSNGLDPTAPWPKFQRDNANRGNSSLPTTPWTCP